MVSLELSASPKLIALDDPILLEMDLSTILGIKKWEAALHASLAGQAEGLFPSFIRKTDQERCQNLKAEIFGYEDEIVPFDVSSLPEDAVTAMQERGIIEWVGDGLGGRWTKVIQAKGDRSARYEVTLKMDGSSMTVFARAQETNVTDVGIVDMIESGVCSRNLQLKVNEENADNTFISVALKSGLLAVLEDLAREGRDYAVQGEVMGPSIQGNREQFTTFKFFVFDIFDIKTGAYLPPAQRRALVKGLQEMGAQIEHVPVLHEAATLDELGVTTMDQLLKFAEGPSLVHKVREGVVFKRVDGVFTFKVISNLFLTKEVDE